MTTNDIEKVPLKLIPLAASESEPLLDDDVLKLAEMGYAQDMQRKLSVWSVLGVGFSLTNSWFGVSAALITGINSGGPVLYVYGIILIFLISSCVGISLSELSSAYPNAGGQYFWASELAPRRYANFASYLTGWFAWSGSIFTSASVALAVSSAIVGCYQLTHPEFVIETFHIVICYELVNTTAFLFNTYGQLLPRIATTTFYVSLISFTIILITIPAAAPTHQRASFVFVKFINSTGWKSDGLAFIVGLINPNWAFSCLDCATHLAEEVEKPERIIPLAIMGTVGIGFVTSWFFSVGMMFSLQDLAGVAGTATLVPILELFNQAVNQVGAVVLETFVICTGMGCLIASHTWQSRLCWSFARDGGVPGHRFLKKVTPGQKMPLAAHSVSCVLVGAIGLLYLVSGAAFNSMVTACITLLYVSYAIPVACLLSRGRERIPHGPFWLGKFGLFANCVLLAWTLFALVMYSLPAVMPVTAGNMNYVSAVYGVIVVIITTDWFARGKNEYRGQEARHKDAIEVERGASSRASERRKSLSGARLIADPLDEADTIQ